MWRMQRVQRATKVYRAFKALRDQLGQKETQVHKAFRVRPAWLGQRALRALRGKMARMVRMARLDPWGLPEQRDLQDQQDQ